MNPPDAADEPDPRGPLPPHEDQLDHLVTLVSDGAPVDLSSEEFDALATRFGDRARALLDVAKIAAFSRALQRRGSEARDVVDEADPLPHWGPFTFL
jgi:hypothetical protein